MEGDHVLCLSPGTCLGTVLALSPTTETMLELRQELVWHKAPITSVAAMAR